MKRAILIGGVGAILAVLGGGGYLWLRAGRTTGKVASTTTVRAAQPASSTPSTNPPPASARNTEPRPMARIEAAVVQSRWPQWLNEPARDPFQLVLAPTFAKPAPDSPVSRFQLRATWLQTGGRLAAIDQKTYAEGDLLAEYRIVAIGANEVLLQGREKAEKISFKSYVPQPTGAGRTRTNLVEQWLGPEKEKVF